MKTYKASSGPFAERIYLSDREIEDTCTDELKAAGLYPERPSPIRIERFIEKRFNVTPEYGDLPDGVLGLTTFGQKGVHGIVIARTLDNDGSATAEKRIRTTMAHEAGHALFHTHLLVMATREHPLFADLTDPSAPRVLCRDVPNKADPSIRAGYDGRWWEYQANRSIGPLLMPKLLVSLAIEPFLVATGSLGMTVLPEARRHEAVRHIAETFQVNPVVARIRLADAFPPAKSAQMTL